MPKRACVITSSGKKVCGVVQTTPTVVQKCVAAVLSKKGAKRKGMNESRAFAICTAQAQKRGLVKPGTRELTRKGAAADAKVTPRERLDVERRFTSAVRPSGLTEAEQYLVLRGRDGLSFLFRGRLSDVRTHVADDGALYGISPRQQALYHASLRSALEGLNGQRVVVVRVTEEDGFVRAVASREARVESGRLVAA